MIDKHFANLPRNLIGIYSETVRNMNMTIIAVYRNINALWKYLELNEEKT